MRLLLLLGAIKILTVKTLHIIETCWLILWFFSITWWISDPLCELYQCGEGCTSENVVMTLFCWFSVLLSRVMEWSQLISSWKLTLIIPGEIHDPILFIHQNDQSCYWMSVYLENLIDDCITLVFQNCSALLLHTFKKIQLGTGLYWRKPKYVP